MVITKLPAPPTPPPDVPSGTVRLYRDNNWSSQYLTIDTHNYASGQRHSIVGSRVQDATTWVAFNLPVGTVMTLADNYVVAPGRPIYDLKDLGVVADLVGTGKTEAVDLAKININDKVSMLFWRRVDLAIGAIELYEHANFGGNRTVLFLADWPRDAVHALTHWYIHDRASSARWSTLLDTQKASLYANADGTGASYPNIKGWGSFREVADFGSVGFTDKLSSFSWSGLVPMKELIEPVQINLGPFGQSGTSLYAHASGRNDSSQPSKQTVTLQQSNAETVTLTVTNTFTVGTQVSFSFKTNYVVAESSMTVQLSFTYAHTETSTTTVTNTTNLSVVQDFSVPAYCDYEATLMVQLGVLPPTATYSTAAWRWYVDQLSGSALDPSNGWYKRRETVTFQLSGSLACGTRLDVKATPLPGHGETASAEKFAKIPPVITRTVTTPPAPVHGG